MKKKSIFRSKTFWFNIINIAIRIIADKSNLSIDPETQGLIVAGGNLILRTMTNSPVSISGK